MTRDIAGPALRRGNPRVTRADRAPRSLPADLAIEETMALNRDEKQDILQKFATHEGDTGSPEVQVALLTARIEYLTNHFQTHVKDHSSRRGLLKLVGQRRRLLKFLKNQDPSRYQRTIEALGLRR